MERDPLRLAWKTKPFRHLFGFLLLAMAGLCLLLGFDLVRTVVDRALAGGTQGSSTFLQIAMTPFGGGGESLVLFPGFTLNPPAFAIATIGGLVLVPLLIAAILTVVDWLAVGIGAAVLTRIRSTILDAVLKAPPSAQDEVETVSALGSVTLAREGSVLGSALFVPVRLGGMVGLALAYVLATSWRLGLALTVVLALGGIMNARRLALRVVAVKARHREGEAGDAAFADLRHRMPALRAHGTGRYERERVRNALVQNHRPVEKRERHLALNESLAATVLMLAPMVVLALGVWFAAELPLTGGALAACILAAALAAFAVRELILWQRLANRAHALLSDLAQGLIALQPRDHLKKASLPENGALVAQGVSAYDSATGTRITGVNLNLAFPSHVALVGDGDSGSRVLAALIAGQLPPSTGQLTFGGADLTAADPVERARRIALAGDTVLIPGTLRENLLYGASAPETEIDRRLTEAIAVAGLDQLTHARGLSGTFNPKREPELATALVESRRAVQDALAREGLDRFVDPFNAERYNRYATLGENLLFGKAIGDTFREDRLSGHPFVRAILEADDLTKPLARIGLSIATSMIEIFAEIPDGHPLFERFGFFSAADRAYFEDLVERRSERRRGIQSGRDQERLIGLALRYNESRHRLGLLDEAMERRILAARADFTRMLPASLRPAIEFYDEHRFCAAASVQDNVLFGRIASDQAGAAASVQKVIRRVLTECGLDADVSRIGLNMPIDPQGSDLTLSEIAAVDLVRCLVRQPDILVVQRALEGLPGPAADTLVAALRRARAGRGLILVTPGVTEAMDQPPFDAVIRFERGEAVAVPRIGQPEPVPA
ncbi:ABC transporter ATP-binding protein [Microvirga terricola]|uniref:ABC transporter ATP-binding protein n=1 Tax=Microvirga terricola TaxID=2719797 RepID=A0ABX0V8P2_9HYPH|nr:ABC transporter ATP-binding protein [Microvirga terricola]NIX75611.1 ABC transporter ATP-binding protein [Microvirga terricola]